MIGSPSTKGINKIAEKDCTKIWKRPESRDGNLAYVVIWGLGTDQLKNSR